MVVKEYRAVEAESSGALNATVNALIKDGWQLYGSIAVYRTSAGITLFVQTMVQPLTLPSWY